MIDDRIAELAKRIDEDRPPPVLMRRWIRNVLSDILDDKYEYREGVNLRENRPIVPGGVRMSDLRECKEVVVWQAEKLHDIWMMVRKVEDCERCVAVRQLSMPTPKG